MQEINKVLEKREYTWGLVGINENKARFFYSKLGKLKTEIGKNLIALEDFCAINMSRGLTNTVDAKSYEWIPTNTEEITKSIQEKGLNITYATQ